MGLFFRNWHDEDDRHSDREFQSPSMGLFFRNPAQPVVTSWLLEFQSPSMGLFFRNLRSNFPQKVDDIQGFNPLQWGFFLGTIAALTCIYTKPAGSFNPLQWGFFLGTSQSTDWWATHPFFLFQSPSMGLFFRNHLT